MRVECPHCHAVFDVPAAILAKARVLRCANCGERWNPPAAPAEAAVEETRERAGDIREAEGAAPESPVFGKEAPEAAAAEVPRAESPPSGPPSGPPPSAGRADPAAVLASVRASARASAAAVPVPKPERPGGRSGWIAAWILSLAVVGGGAAAAWHWKGSQIARLWSGGQPPPAAHVAAR